MGFSLSRLISAKMIPGMTASSYQPTRSVSLLDFKRIEVTRDMKRSAVLALTTELASISSKRMVCGTVRRADRSKVSMLW